MFRVNQSLDYVTLTLANDYTAFCAYILLFVQLKIV
jgi:hypothetical protein